MVHFIALRFLLHFRQEEIQMAHGMSLNSLFSVAILKLCVPKIFYFLGRYALLFVLVGL